MRVGIIGAGISGLVTSRSLDREGVDHVVFEASDRPGGVIRSRSVAGQVLDYGPQRLRLTPAVADLVEDLGIRDRTVAPSDDRPLFVYADGRLREVPLDLRTFLRTDLLSWRGKLRLLAEPLTRSGRAEESVRDLLVRKFGQETAANFLGPLLGGIYGSDPAEMVAGQALPRLLAMEDRHGSILRGVVSRARADERPDTVTFKGGMAEFPNALYRSVADRVRLGTPVESVRPADGRFVIVSENDRTRVDAVVITTPASAAGTILKAVDADASRRLKRLAYSPLAVVHLTAELDRPGMGYQIRRNEGLQTLGVTWNASLFDRKGVYTCFLADGDGWPDQSDRTIARVARDEFRAVTGATASVIDVTRLRPGMPAYDRSWTALEDIELPPRIHLAGSFVGGPGIPSRVREASSIVETVTDGRGVPAPGTGPAHRPTSL